jgi:hypothetical protein
MASKIKISKKNSAIDTKYLNTRLLSFKNSQNNSLNNI